MNIFLRSAVAMTALAAFGAAPASAATVMIKGSNSIGNITSFLTSNGHTVVADSANYTGVNAVVLLRIPGDAGLASFVLGGGRLVTEWDGADWAMSNLLGGSVSGGDLVGTGTTVTFTAAGVAAGLDSGVGPSYAAGPASEFFRTFSSIGTGSVLATRPGAIAAIVGGAAGSGYVIANGIDWADSFPTSQANGQVLLNSITGGNVGGVPEPASWAMMIGGFGIVGATMRRRRRMTVSFG
jgi:hypothetical protein